MPTTPADRNGCMCRLLPHSALAFPKLWVGRHPHCPFRGLLRLHSRYSPHACSTAQGGLCHGASTEPVARPRRPLATSAIDNSLGGTLLHKCFAPSRRTRVCGRRESDRTSTLYTIGQDRSTPTTGPKWGHRPGEQLAKAETQCSARCDFSQLTRRSAPEHTDVQHHHSLGKNHSRIMCSTRAVIGGNCFETLRQRH